MGREYGVHVHAWLVTFQLLLFLFCSFFFFCCFFLLSFHPKFDVRPCSFSLQAHTLLFQQEAQSLNAQVEFFWQQHFVGHFSEL